MMDMAEKLWDVANYVTGFAVAQTLATTYALGKREMKGLHDAAGHWLAFVTTMVLTAGYLAAIYLCGTQGAKLDNQYPDLWKYVMIGRVVTVCLFTLILLGTILGHRHTQKEEETRNSLV